MFPTFDVPPQHAETVGARKARKAKEDGTTRRASSATSHSSGSTRSSTKPVEKSGWSWGSKKKNKEIQEISTLPSARKSQPVQEEPAPEPELEPEPSPSPSPSISPSQDWTASLAYRHEEAQRPPAQRSYTEPQHFPPPPQQYFAPPPSRSLPSIPPVGALPQRPSPGPDLGLRGKCIDFAFVYQSTTWQNCAKLRTLGSDQQRSAENSAKISEDRTSGFAVARVSHLGNKWRQ